MICTEISFFQDKTHKVNVHLLSKSICSEIFDGVVTLFLLPETEVLLEELDDRLGISEGFFIDIIDLLQGLGQSLLTKFTGLFVVIHHFIVEDREVQSKTKSNWVACIKTL